jgi:hypothetical protein
VNLRKIVLIIIAVNFAIIVGWWIFVGIVIYKGSADISENGIAGVVHNLWCGKRVDCKIPGVEE